MSEYQNLCRHFAKEPEAAKQLKVEATRFQKQGDYLKATEKMQAAVAELKRVYAC